MDENVTVNLGLFLLPSPALAIPSPANLLNNLPKNPPDCINFFI